MSYIFYNRTYLSLFCFVKWRSSKRELICRPQTGRQWSKKAPPFLSTAHSSALPSIQLPAAWCEGSEAAASPLAVPGRCHLVKGPP